MENWKVKEVSSEPEKTQAEIERELVAKAEAKNEEAPAQDDKPTPEATTEGETKEIDDAGSDQEVPVTDATPSPQLNEEQVLSFLKNRYNKEINTLDDLVNTKPQKDLPQEVSDFLHFQEKTGGTFEDFKKLNRNLEEVDDDQLLREHLKETQPFLDDEDIEFELKNKYGFDDTLDAEDEIRAKKISKKKGVLDARNYFTQKAKDFQSQTESVEVDKKGSKEIDSSDNTNNINQERAEKQSKWFAEKTDAYFNTKFNGFKFKVNDTNLVYEVKAEDLSAVKDTHSNFHNFLNMHLNEDGYLKDAEKYHKALAAAFNPDGFAKFFYEKGQADAISADVKETKNVDMGYRSSPVSNERGKFKVTDTTSDKNGSSLKIKSNRNK